MAASDMIAPMIDPRSELADVLDTILRDLGQVVRYDQVRILLLPSVLDMQGSDVEDDENTLLITVRASGAPLGRYPLNRVLMTSQKPIVIADTRDSELWVAASTQQEEIRAWIGAPLVVKGESIGVLAAHSITPHAFTERDGIIVFAFASQAAEAIDKVRLLDQAQNRLHAMMALYEASLDVLGHSADPDRLLIVEVVANPGAPRRRSAAGRSRRYLSGRSRSDFTALSDHARLHGGLSRCGREDW